MMEIYLLVTSDTRDRGRSLALSQWLTPLGFDNSVYGDLEFSSP